MAQYCGNDIYHRHKAISDKISLGFTENKITGARQIKMNAIIKPAREKGFEMMHSGKSGKVILDWRK